MVQLLVEQVEKLLVNQKEESVEGALWFQIQGLMKKLGILLKVFKKDQCGVKDFTAGKRDPDSGEYVTRSGKHNAGKKGGKLTKDRFRSKSRNPLKHPVKKLNTRRNPLKLSIKIPKSSTDTFTVTRPKLQRQYGVIEG